MNETAETYQTPKMQYRDHTYWIAGETPVKKKPGKYHYFILKPGKTKPAQSDQEFKSVVPANQAAREAIDLLSDVLTKAQEVLPSSLKQRGRKLKAS